MLARERQGRDEKRQGPRCAIQQHRSGVVLELSPADPSWVFFCTKALDEQRSWSKSADNLCRHSSRAATTALAVVTFSALDKEIDKTSAGEASLDDLVRALYQYDNAIDLAALQTIAAQLGTDKSDVLDTDNLPGCRSIETDSQETS